MTVTIETIKYLISFYNQQAGTRFRMGTDPSRVQFFIDAVSKAESVAEFKQHIRDYIYAHEADAATTECFSECFESFASKAPQPEVPAPQAQVTDTQVNYSMGILEQAVIQLIAKANTEKIEQATAKTIEERVRDFMQSEYGPVTRRITTVINDIPRPTQGIHHEKLETVLKFVANNEPVYLTGPAGSGKNVICKQVAEALGLKFYFTNAVTQEYQLKGFTDANGKYQETQFYKAFTEGGVFMLDEMDASVPETLIILNAAIANRYFDFPAPIGYREAHPDFRVVVAGNTIGHGADFEYVGRNQLDAASLDRFAIVKIDYSKNIEDGLAGDIELADFCRAFRKSADTAKISVVVSYRAIGRLAKMLQLLSTEEALDTCLIKGLEKDDVNIILNGISESSKYTKALKHLLAQMN